MANLDKVGATTMAIFPGAIVGLSLFGAFPGAVGGGFLGSNCKSELAMIGLKGGFFGGAAAAFSAGLLLSLLSCLPHEAKLYLGSYWKNSLRRVITTASIITTLTLGLVEFNAFLGLFFYNQQCKLSEQENAKYFAVGGAILAAILLSVYFAVELVKAKIESNNRPRVELPPCPPVREVREVREPVSP